MTHEQALAYWFRHINYEHRVPGTGDLHLDRMRGLMARLGNPQKRLRILHVAGSKGKGSVSAMLAAILQRARYRTGLFTSPHLSRLEERFRIDGRSILPGEMAVGLTEIREAVERGRAGAPPCPDNPPTFFEIATALGMLHFFRRRVDVAILEVGLGGRFDSTNVCQPVLSILTSISLDHTQVLGDRLSSIAREKAGIIKPGRPVVSGVTVPEAREVIEEVSRERNAPLEQLDVDFHFRHRAGFVQPDGIRRPVVEVDTRARRWPPLEVNLLGRHQAANAAVVLACIDQLRQVGWKLSDEAVAEGLREVFWPARMEVVAHRPTIVLDCAHNGASAVALVETLRESFLPGRRLLVFASSGDKDVSGMFQVLAGAFDRAFLCRFGNNPRALAPEQLAVLWSAAGTKPCSIHPSSLEALQAARAAAGPDDLVCIAGSVFLAGELRPHLVVTS